MGSSDGKANSKSIKRAFIGLLLKVSGNVNADAGVGTRIPLKKIITMNKEIKAFVSSRCIRRAIRKRMQEHGLSVDPMYVQNKRLYDVADPIKYVDDDLFGYLAPGEVTSRSASIKISPLIALRHTEIKVEFAARFPRYDFIKNAPKEFPTPFEVEVAEWIGRLNVIISDRVGRFHKDELTTEVIEKIKNKEKEYSNVTLDKNSNEYVLEKTERANRLSTFLGILLREGWEFPRGSQSPNVPDYHYCVVVLSDRFLPIFGYVDINDDGTFNTELFNNMLMQYRGLYGNVIVIDYKLGKAKFYNSNAQLSSEKKLDDTVWAEIIEEITRYIIE